MGADSTSFLTVLSMGTFTVLSIVVGYVMLNSAVSDQVQKSAYYGFTRFVGMIQDAFEKESSSISNVYFYPQYVIFSAYFNNINDIEYYSYEGQRLNDVAVNDDSKTLFNQIIKSASLDNPILQSVNSERRKELIKCVGHSCICFGQMTTNLFVEKDYLIPNACVDICWGEDPKTYKECVSSKSDEDLTPKEIMKYCNKQSTTPKCKSCVDYMENFDNNLIIKNGDNFNVLTIKLDQGNDLNSYNYLKLEEFSNKTKFSFIPKIIECVQLDSLAKTPNCGTSPYLMKFDNDLFLIFTTSNIVENEKNSNHILFDLFTLNYEQNDLFTPNKCYLYNDFIKSSYFNPGDKK